MLNRKLSNKQREQVQAMISQSILDHQKFFHQTPTSYERYDFKASQRLYEIFRDHEKHGHTVHDNAYRAEQIRPAQLAAMRSEDV